MDSFTIYASKENETIETQAKSPTITVAKANMLHKSGWKVHITDSSGRRYGPARFTEILSFDRKQPLRF